ncbi:MAG: hypothetical protein AB9903_24700 [Vulcanimicrobiota bacterium]
MPVINDKNDFYRFAVTLPLGIKDTDDYKTILSRIEVFLNNFEPCDDFERYSLLATKQSLYGCKTGGFGIGAILVNPRGEVVDEAYNEMIQAGRSDLHAEMDLIDKYESNRNNPVHATFQLPPGYLEGIGISIFNGVMIGLRSDFSSVVKNGKCSERDFYRKLGEFQEEISCL